MKVANEPSGPGKAGIALLLAIQRHCPGLPIRVVGPEDEYENITRRNWGHISTFDIGGVNQEGYAYEEMHCGAGIHSVGRSGRYTPPVQPHNGYNRHLVRTHNVNLMNSYEAQLQAVKAHYPFSGWRESGLEQYTEEACSSFVAVFDQLITKLAALGANAPEEAKLALFREAIQATNKLNEQDESLIETGEREDLCELTNRVAVAAGLDPAKYGAGEGPASEWRDW